MKAAIALLALLLISSASAIDIVSPQPARYNLSTVKLVLLDDHISDNISYSVDGTWNNGCFTCSVFDKTFTLGLGDHVISVRSTTNSTVTESSVNFSIGPPSNKTASVNTSPPYIVTIDNPRPITYFSTKVPLAVRVSREVYAISAVIEGTYGKLCEHCSSFNSTLNISGGNQTVLVTGWFNGSRIEQTVNFNVFDSSKPTFSLDVRSPARATYYNHTIDLQVISNVTLDSLELSDGTKTQLACTTCSSYTAVFDLTQGSYKLVAKGTVGNRTRETTVNFIVSDEPKPLPVPVTGLPYTGNKFERLPDLLRYGELNDTQLASVVRANKIDYTVLNDLAKTYVLGEESTQAILETQSISPGFFQKLLNAIGFFEKRTFSEELWMRYELPVRIQRTLITHPETPKSMSATLRKELESMPTYNLGQIAPLSLNETVPARPMLPKKQLTNSSS